MDLRALTIQKVLDNAEQKWGGRAYIWEKKDGAYLPKTLTEFARDVRGAAGLLLSKGLYGGQVAVLGKNSYEYMVADLAIMGYVGISVTFNPAWGVEDLARALDMLEVRLFFYDASHKDVASELEKEYPAIEFMGLDGLAEAIEGMSGEGEFAGIDPAQPSKIMFTSGTTSRPKASLLSQRNMFAGWNSLSRRAQLTDSDRGYLFLPLFHTFAGVYNFLYSLIGGCQIYLCSDTAKIAEELQEVRPTVFCVVPLILERLYGAIGERDKAKAKRAMRLSRLLLPFGIDLRKRMFRKVHEALGGNLRYLFCAGAKLDSEVKAFFKDAGVNLLEAYALTETASSLALEYPRSKDLGSVGVVYEDIEVRIDRPDEAGVGEIMVRGDNVCLGYYKNEKANEEAFEKDGYFRTGDLGRVTGGGKLFLEGRKRRMALGSNGENVYLDEEGEAG